MSVDGKVLMSLVMLVIFGGMVGMATTYPPETRLLPLVIGIPGILLAAIQVAMDFADAKRKAGSVKDSEAEEPAPAAQVIKRERPDLVIHQLTERFLDERPRGIHELLESPRGPAQ